MLVVPASPQSGRRPPPPKPAPAPSEPGLLELKKSSKPSLPEFFDGERIYTSKETDEKAKILKKPIPRYPGQSRRQTRGYVILRAILAADETVKHIEVITGVPNGFTESSIAAARQIKFKPAMKDGKPVSVWVELEYTYQIY